MHFSRSLLTRPALRPAIALRAERPDAEPVGSSAAEALTSAQQPFPGVQSSSGIEVVSEAIPTEAVSSDSITEPLTTPAEPPLDSMTVPQLKEQLKLHSLPVGGRKAELIQRLETAIAAEQQVSTPAAAQDPVVQPGSAFNEAAHPATPDSRVAETPSPSGAAPATSATSAASALDSASALEPSSELTTSAAEATGSLSSPTAASSTSTAAAADASTLSTSGVEVVSEAAPSGSAVSAGTSGLQGVEVVPDTAAEPALSTAREPVSALTELPEATGIEMEPQVTPTAAAVSSSVSEALSPQTGPTPDVEGIETMPGVTPAAEGVEAVPAATPTSEAVSTSVSEALASQSENGTSPLSEWETAFQSVLDVVDAGSHFPNDTPSAKSFSIGGLKRGLLHFARARQDILFNLPEEKIRSIIAAELPYSERKVQPFHLQVQLSCAAVSPPAVAVFKPDGKSHLYCYMHSYGQHGTLDELNACTNVHKQPGFMCGPSTAATFAIAYMALKAAFCKERLGVHPETMRRILHSYS